MRQLNTLEILVEFDAAIRRTAQMGRRRAEAAYVHHLVFANWCPGIHTTQGCTVAPAPGAQTDDPRPS